MTEFATAVAGWALGINPFDQPNVQEAKDNTAQGSSRRATCRTRSRATLEDLLAKAAAAEGTSRSSAS